MKKIARTTAISIVAAGFMAASAQAAEWRFNNPLLEKRTQTTEFIQFAEDVKKNTNGEIDITVYSGGSRGLKNTDALRFLPKGAVDMSMVWANYLGRDAPALGTVMVQGTIGSEEELRKVLPVVKDIYSEAFAEWVWRRPASWRCPCWKPRFFAEKSL